MSILEARMFELGQMGAARHGEAPKERPEPSPLAQKPSITGSSTSSQVSGTVDWSLTMETLVLEAEKRLKKVAIGHEALQDDLHALVLAFKQVRFERHTQLTLC